ncbi:MAG: hypothetical protein IPK60_22265 [Sandaracinaceae bacterium]|jgi:hypothetical protein|nr:hypothetical protein [Sandaracinaceae bacterium]
MVVCTYVAQVAKPISIDSGTAEGLDEELLALPAPPRGRRFLALTLMALTVVCSLGLLVSLQKDVRYFFADTHAVELGEATAVNIASLPSNAYVRVRGTPMVSHMAHATRALGGTTYALFPLAGQRAIFVEMPVASADDERRMSRREWSGRLVTFGELGGRFASVRSYLREHMDVPVTSETYLLLADETPGEYVWSLGLSVLCVAFIIINVLLMLRWFRKLPPSNTARA